MRVKCGFYLAQPDKSHAIIRQLVTATSSLLNKPFDNEVCNSTNQTGEGIQGQKKGRPKERGEFLQSHSQSSVTPSVSLPSDNFQC